MVGLGTQRARLTPEFLRQKIKLAADGPTFSQQGCARIDVRLETIKLLADIGARGQVLALGGAAAFYLV